MNIGLKIKQLSDSRRMPISEISEKLGKTKQAVYHMIESRHVNTEILEKISNIFSIPITYFFTDDDSSLPAVVVGKEQTKELAYPDADVGKEIDKYKKALHRERKARKKEKEQLASLIEQNAKLTNMLAK